MLWVQIHPIRWGCLWCDAQIIMNKPSYLDIISTKSGISLNEHT